MAKAIDGLDAERSARRPIDLEAVGASEVGDKILAAERLTGFGAAEFENRAVGRLGSKIMIEADNADRLGLGDVERLGDEGDRGAVDVAETLLQIMQDRQHGSGFAAPSIDQRARLLITPGRLAQHPQASQ